MAMVQYGLWPNCTNHCDFCLLFDRDYKTVEQRLYILKTVKENIAYIGDEWRHKFSDGISLLGGEIFYTDSEEVKESFMDLIDLIIEKILKPIDSTVLSVVTNGIYDSKILLEPVMDKLVQNDVLKKFDLNFSWDIKGRFHSDKALNQMIQNTNMVYEKYGAVPHVQTCLTQHLIDVHLDGSFNIFEYQKEHFPNTLLAFLYPHKINTGIEVNDFFFTRASFFKFVTWLKSNGYNETLQSFIQSVINSAQFKYSGIFDRSSATIKVNQMPTLERKQILTGCGHSQLYRCYSDSHKCMLCDIMNIV